MNFEYDGSEDKCVAYIDGDGDLFILTDNVGWMIVSGDETGVCHAAPPDDNPTGVEYRFYPGDKLTITF